METVQQNGRFTLFSSKFLSIHSILFDICLNYLLKCQESRAFSALHTHPSFFLQLSNSPFFIVLFKLLKCSQIFLLKGIESLPQTLTLKRYFIVLHRNVVALDMSMSEL